MSNHLSNKSPLAITLMAALATTGIYAQADETDTLLETSSQQLQQPTSDSEGVTPDVTPAETPATDDTAASSDVNDTGVLDPTVDSLDTTPSEGEVVDVRILSTTDLHTNLVNYDYYQDKASETVGLSKTALLIAEAKKENSNVLLVDNGDTIQGTPLGTYKSIVDPIEDGEKHPMYAALESLGFEVGTLGNHEFNYGLDYLNKVISSTSIPIVNANVVDANTKAFVYQPYVLLTKTFSDSNGRAVSLKIGVTGIVPPQIMSWDKANLDGKIDVLDSVEAVEAIVPTIREAGADIILVLSHSGIGDDVYEKGEENVGYQIAGIKGVDAVVTGHSHAEFPSGNGTGFYEKYAGVDGIEGKINGTPVTMAGKYGDHLGLIDLSLTYTNGRWQVTNSKASIRKIDTKSAQSDTTILHIAQEAHDGTVAYVRQQVGTTTAPITSYFALVKDDPSIQIVNNAQLWYAKQELAGTPEGQLPLLSAAAPFKAGTRGDATAYTDIPSGAIAIKNVADLYLYDNVTAIVKVTGRQLREWLEMSAGQFQQIDPSSSEPQYLVNSSYRTYNFDVIDGVTYQFDITKPAKYDRNGKLIHPDSQRVTNLQYQGLAVTDQQEFIVVTNNYRANGTFPGVQEASYKRLLNLENRQAIINYILSEKTINPTADANWSFTDNIRGLDLRFVTADRAKELLSAHKEVTYLGLSSTYENFGEFRLTYMEPTDLVSENTPTPALLPIDTLTLPESGLVITLPTLSPAVTTRPTQTTDTANLTQSTNALAEDRKQDNSDTTPTTKTEKAAISESQHKTERQARTNTNQTKTKSLSVLLVAGVVGLISLLTTLLFALRKRR